MPNFNILINKGHPESNFNKVGNQNRLAHLIQFTMTCCSACSFVFFLVVVACCIQGCDGLVLIEQVFLVFFKKEEWRVGPLRFFCFLNRP
jgi:hypothetical protein